MHRIAIATLALVVVGLMPPTAAADEPKMPPAKWRSKYGYQRAVWGMTVEELQKVYPTATEEEDRWHLMRRHGLRSLELSNQTVAGFEGKVSFIFVSDRLSRCVVLLPCPQTGTCEDRAAAVLQGLDSKYGKRLGPPPGDEYTDYVWFFGRSDPRSKARDHVWATEVSVALPKSSDSVPVVAVYYFSLEMPQRGDSSGL